MIQKQSNLKIIDNSGVKKVMCIHLLTKHRKNVAYIGDVIIAAVKKINSKKQNIKVKKGQVVKALIVRTKSFTSENTTFCFKENAAIILSSKKKFLGTRIFGGIQTYFRKTKYLKIISISKGKIL